ncbi:MAG: phosphotransferase [Chloroflexota bacterium]
MKPYNELTLRGKARRLRVLAWNTLKHYELDVRKLRLISNDQNGIFRIDTSDGQKYILRVAMPDAGHSLAEIQSEKMWLNHLKNLTGINAPQPIKAKNGKWIVTETAPGVPQPRHCSIFTWVPGVDLGERRTPENWRAFGELSALMHEAARDFTPTADFSIPVYDTIFMFAEDNVLFNPENRHAYKDGEADLIRQALERIEREISDIHQTQSDKIRVTHGDLHHWNVRTARGKVSPIDFEDIMWAHPIQDIGVSLYYNRLDDNYDALLTAFKAGYESVTSWIENYPGQLEVHILARRLHLLNFIFAATEFDISQFPKFLPAVMQRIAWVQEHVWDKI